MCLHEGTHLAMRTWFTALYLVAASSKGISSVKLAEHLGIGQKTAWFLSQRIRRMMEDESGLLSGIVEVDETYLGGKAVAKGKISKRDHDDDQPIGRAGSRKAMVTVATERGGRAPLRACAIQPRDRPRLAVPPCPRPCPRPRPRALVPRPRQARR
jgi:hypothetical protein